jgi:hypothetical protein
MNVCELTLAVSHPHRSRIGTTGWGTWRMLRRVRERSRPSSPSQLWVAGPLSPYNVIIYFVQNFYYIVKMWHSILCHDSSYVWDLAPAHLVIMFAPGLWTPKTRVWHMDTSMLGRVAALIIRDLGRSQVIFLALARGQELVVSIFIS